MTSHRLQPSRWPQALLGAYAHHVRPGQGLLLAVSGGLDSTALLVATAELGERLGVRVEVACLDHGLRPEAAHEIGEVRALSASLGLRMHTRKLKLTGRGNLESRARRARYQALEALRKQLDLDWIVTAHSASDQAETLLMRLVRGTALRGARAIHRRQGRLLRPMLGVTRESARTFLEERSVRFAEDPMNRDPRFLRVRIRHELMPLLRALGGPATENRLAQFALQAAEEEALLEAKAEAAFERVGLPNGALDAVGLRALERPLQRRVLRALLERHGLPCSSRLLASVEGALARGGSCPLPERGELSCQGGRVRLLSSDARGSEVRGPALEVPLTDVPVRVGQWELFLATGPCPAEGQFWPLPHPGPWRVRTRRRGDVVHVRGKSQRLQDVFVNSKVPREDRGEWPLVCDARTGEICWVVGLSSRNDAAGQGPGVLARKI